MPRTPFAVFLIVAALLAEFCLLSSRAVAGTTGGLSGVVTETDSLAPVAKATVTVVSPSQTTTATTDASGHFSFVSLTPDTYSISVEKSGYDSLLQNGLTIQADTAQNLTLHVRKTLQEIGHVVTRINSSLIKPGQTADLYSINSGAASRAAGFGGGGSLDAAFSGIASVPGTYVPAGGNGWFQTVLIRGGDYPQVGYEFDGVPVNRSFDNYPASTGSALGQQELQVYTGSSPTSAESQGLSGYINQVIKSGTYPGFADANVAVGAPTFYHKLNFEIGGATKNRLFSYYAAAGGYDEDFRVVDQFNAASLQQYGTPFDEASCPNPGASGGTLTPGQLAQDQNFASCYAGAPNFGAVGPGGYLIGPLNAGSTPTHVTDRENVVNLHFGIPHHNDGGKDDIQLLYDTGELLNYIYGSPDDFLAPQLLAQEGGSGTLRAGLPVFPGPGKVYSGAVAQPLPSNFASLVQPYIFPTDNTPGGGGQIPLTRRDMDDNDQAILKLQYQKNFGSSAFARIYGYTFYSDWFENGANASNGFGVGPPANYELSTHTRGLSVEVGDQVNAQNLLQGQYSLSTAATQRIYDTSYTSSATTPFAWLVDATNPISGVCYNDSGGVTASPVSCNGSPTTVKLGAASAAIPAGETCGGHPCEFYVADTGNSGLNNRVRPDFQALSLTDDFTPTQKLHFTFGLRYQNYQFQGADTSGGARPFWFAAWNQGECVGTAPGSKPVAKTGDPTLACPAGTVPATLVNAPVNYDYTVWEPRVGLTYTVDPLTVLRANYGKYAQPANAASEQYDVLQQNLPAYIGPKFLGVGFDSPGHQIAPELSFNLDFSLEHQFKGSDLSFKLTPYLRKTSGENSTVFIDPKNFVVSSVPVGNLTAQGIELALDKGDFNRDGFAAQLSYTYNYATIKYSELGNGQTVIDPINSDIKNYNAYTSFCAANAADPRCGLPTNGMAASACYSTGGAPAPGCPAGSVANPYWNAPVQALLSRQGPYFPTDTVTSTLGLNSGNSYFVPHTIALILQYKKKKWAFTPSFQLEAGQRYGTPETESGIDPASGCQPLTNGAGVAQPLSPTDPRYTGGTTGFGGASGYNAVTCAGALAAIPDPYTGQFDAVGAFVSPTQLLGHLQITYDASSRISFQLQAVNLIQECFGGSNQPWTAATGSPKTCDYTAQSSAAAYNPVGNFYNPGQAIQPYVQYPYLPFYGVYNPNVNGGFQAPFDLYLTMHVKV